MPFTRQEYIGKISDILPILQAQLTNRNNLGLYDSNSTAEDFFCGFLNILEDWNLKNANEIQKNFPGIDLIDGKKQIVVQVSSKKDSDKIQHSIDEFLEKFKPREEYQFYMLVITKKQLSYSTEFHTLKTVTFEDGSSGTVEVIFDKDTNIWDTSDLLKKVKISTTDKLEKLYKYLEQELSMMRAEKDSSDSQSGGSKEQLPEYPNANQYYAAGFVRPLFLHEKNEKVTLENLFVWQDYSEKNEKKHQTLEARIRSFTRNTGEKLLIIEGDAGTGKSTLVQRMNHDYANYIKQKQKENVGERAENQKTTGEAASVPLFGGRELVTVRLRDISPEIRKEAAEEMQETAPKGIVLLNVIAKHLKQTPQQIKTSLENTFYVLDGFDELCTSDSGIDAHKMIQNLSKNLPSSAKIMVTSRPDYLGGEQGAGIRRIVLKKLDQKKRNEWLANYTDLKKCGQALPDYLKKYIENIGENKSIYDVPLNLYMLVAKKPAEDKLQNTWSLYRDILYENIRDTAASQQTENDKELVNREHPDAGNWDVYYRICEEIAYEMYKTDNKKLYVTTDEIKNIIRRLRKERTAGKPDTFFENLEKNCHALCGFWKIDLQSGIYEFYHNDIRDFFLCEKVYWELNRIYRDCRNLDEREIENGARKMAELFQYGRLEKKVLLFLNERAEVRFQKEGESLADFSAEEYKLSFELKCFPAISQMVLTNEKVYPDAVENTEKNSIASHATMIKSILEILAVTNYTLLKEGEYTWLWKSVKAVNRRGILRYIFLEKDENLWLPGVNLDRMQLKGACLAGADLRKCSLKEVNLENANLGNVDLKGCVWIHAELEHVNLERADMNDCVLANVNLKYAGLQDADLRNSKLRQVDFSYADLSFGKLQGAELEETNFHAAKLYGMEPEVIRKIREADNFTWADFTGSNPQNWKNELIPGGLYAFGSYWQGESEAEGKSQILWRILDVDQEHGRALLLADQILDCEPFDREGKSNLWEKCSLREWLNGEKRILGSREDCFLYQAFDSAEQKRMCTVKVSGEEIVVLENSSQQKHQAGEKLFLLSKEEVIRYFGRGEIEPGYWIGLNGKQSVAVATGYAKQRNYSKRLYVNQENGASTWWLRSGGGTVGDAMFVIGDGSVHVGGNSVNSRNVGVRPAFWLNLKS